MSIIDRMKNEILLFDGGLGTQLQERGLRAGELPEIWNITHPDVICDIHMSYLEAGSDIITTNTFGANSLKYNGKDGYSVYDIVSAAVKCAKKAAAEYSLISGREVYTALDVGPSGRMLSPLGDLDFEDAVGLFAEVVKTGAECGADIVLIETMNDSYETKAAVLAAKENCSLPVFVTNVYDESAHLMTGADVCTMVSLLEGLRADAIGINCGFGPEAMRGAVSELLEYASIPVIVNPNAGLPRVLNGKTVYDVPPEDFAASLAEMVDAGVRLVGGCCGTTPAHIKALSAAVKGKRIKQTAKKNRTVVTSGVQSVFIGEKTALIGERINPTGKRRIKDALRTQNYGIILEEAISQEKKGVHILDVNAGLPEIDEASVIEKLVFDIQGITNLPLQIDTSDPAAMERALRIYNGKAMINSVNGKEESMNAVFPLAAKYGGVIVGLTLDENGIPQTAEGRLAIARRICARAGEYGILKKDIVIDPLVMAVSADQTAARVTLDSVKLIKEELGVGVSLGVSNVSFGLPERDYLNSVFFAEALSRGLDAAIMNPYAEQMMTVYHTHLALSGKDANFNEYIMYASSVKTSVEVSHGADTLKTGEQSTELDRAIVSGLAEKSAQITKVLLETNTGLEIIDRYIIPSLNEVGEGFEQKRVFLPQLLMSAEAAKASFDVIKENMPKDSEGASKGKIVLATVKGDIHDIGKNIVKVLLENFGYTVIDLGRDVPPETVLHAAKEHNVKMVGLSALMTTTVPAMEETVKLIHAELPECVTAVGGAVLSAEYAEMIGADRYCKDAMETVRYANEIFGH